MDERQELIERVENRVVGEMLTILWPYLTDHMKALEEVGEYFNIEEL